MAHRALGCRGVSRTDFRYDDRPNGTGELVVLEAQRRAGTERVGREEHRVRLEVEDVVATDRELQLLRDQTAQLDRVQTDLREAAL